MPLGGIITPSMHDNNVLSHAGTSVQIASRDTTLLSSAAAAAAIARRQRVAST